MLPTTYHKNLQIAETTYQVLQRHSEWNCFQQQTCYSSSSCYGSFPYEAQTPHFWCNEKRKPRKRRRQRHPKKPSKDGKAACSQDGNSSDSFWSHGKVGSLGEAARAEADCHLARLVRAFHVLILSRWRSTPNKSGRNSFNLRKASVYGMV